MAGFQFTKATKSQAKARIAITGPAGSGKTWTALLLATAICKRVAVFDTEHGSASVSYTLLRAHETVLDLVCRLLLEKKKKTNRN